MAGSPRRLIDGARLVAQAADFKLWPETSADAGRFGPRDRVIVDRGRMPEMTAHPSAGKRDQRTREVPRIGSFTNDSRSMALLRRDRFIDDCGRMPNSSIIKQRQSGRHC